MADNFLKNKFPLQQPSLWAVYRHDAAPTIYNWSKFCISCSMNTMQNLKLLVENAISYDSSDHDLLSLQTGSPRCSWPPLLCMLVHVLLYRPSQPQKWHKIASYKCHLRLYTTYMHMYMDNLHQKSVTTIYNWFNIKGYISCIQSTPLRDSHQIVQVLNCYMWHITIEKAKPSCPQVAP